MKSKNENPNQQNDAFNQKGGVSGQQPGSNQGQVSGDARNTRGLNVPSHQGQSGGAKKGKADPEARSPQGSHAKPSDSRGADSSDKEFRNNQPNASTLQGYKNKPGAGKDKK